MPRRKVVSMPELTAAKPPPYPTPIDVGGHMYYPIKEGKATILISTKDSIGQASHQDGPNVFYNPIQQYNRDLTVLVIKTFGELLVQEEEKDRQERKKKEENRRNESRMKRKRETEKRSFPSSVNPEDEPSGHDDAKRSKFQWGIIKLEEKANVKTDKNTGVTADEKAGAKTDEKAGVKADENAGVKADEDFVMTTDEDAEIKPDEEVDVDVQTGEKVETNPDKKVEVEASEKVKISPGKEVEVEAGEKVKISPDEAVQIKTVQDAQPSTESNADGANEPAPAYPAWLSFKILDALSASGLRALRYAHEIPFVTSVVANDIALPSFHSICRNVKYNGLDDKVVPSQENALSHMYRVSATALDAIRPRGTYKDAARYNVIDLDPYGTASTFFDAALLAVRDGGLLCVTCTDSGVWAGHGHPEKAYCMYGGMPAYGIFSHESGLRLILHAICSAAARHGMSIEPLLSLFVDFYARVFVRVTRSMAAAKFLASNTMMVYSCEHGCSSWDIQYLAKYRRVATKFRDRSVYKHTAAQPMAESLCRHCGARQHIAGPMYGGYIHSPGFVRAVLDQIPGCDPSVYGTLPRIEGMLTTALEEIIPPKPQSQLSSQPRQGEEEPLPPLATHVVLPSQYGVADPAPFYTTPGKLASILGCETPNEQIFRGALRQLGYTATRSHCRGGSIKTDAPWDVMWSVMREWVRQKAPLKSHAPKTNHPAWAILGPELIPTKKEVISKGGGKKEKKTGGGGEEEKENKTGGESEGEEETTGAEGGEEETTGGEGEAEGEGEGEENTGGRAAEEKKRQEEPKVSLVFDEVTERLGQNREDKKLLRYQPNPYPNWGPMAKARGK